MSHIYVKSEKIVDANPEDVYAVISDYREKRPQLLTSNFVDYKVERGGRGDGTVVSYRLHAARRERPYHIQVKEPVKGQVLVENDTNSSLVTTWTVSPIEDGQRTNVRLVTEWEGGSGINGFFERTFAPIGLRRIYNTVLNHLDTTLPTTGKKARPESLTLTRETPPESVKKNVSLLALILGGVIALAAIISYLQRSRA